MIIQRPDGSYELYCPLPPLIVVWLHGLARTSRALATAALQRVARGGGAQPQCDRSPCA
jgi:hypothetical protein